MKMFINVYLLSIAIFIGTGIYAQDLPLLNVEIVNNTTGDITIIDGDLTITVPSQTTNNFILLASLETDTSNLPGGHPQIENNVSIATNSGNYTLAWLLSGAIRPGVGNLIIKKENPDTGNSAEVARISRPRKPMIVFEEGAEAPTMYRVRW